jgi:hypothetical protein
MITGINSTRKRPGSAGKVKDLKSTLKTVLSDSAPSDSSFSDAEPVKNMQKTSQSNSELTERDPNNFTYSISDALSASKRARKNVLVIFYNNFNTLSKRFYREILSDRSVLSSIMLRGPVCLIDCDRRAGDMRKYRVWHIPSVLVLRPDGKELARLEKYVNQESFLIWLRDKHK